jgi:hypothetical protein
MREIWKEGLILNILRLILPPFHPIKYWWIRKRYGKQKDRAWN